MNNFYDNLLIKNVEEQNINYTVISNLSYYMENLSKHSLLLDQELILVAS